MEIQSSLTSVVNGCLSSSPSPCRPMTEAHSNHEQAEPSAITTKCDQKIVRTPNNACEDPQAKILKVCDFARRQQNI